MLGWEEDREMGRAVPSSSEQLDLLSCFGELVLCRQLLCYGKLDRFFYFSLLPGKQQRVQGKREYRTPAYGESVVGLSYFSVVH